MLEDDIKDSFVTDWNNNNNNELVVCIRGCAEELQRWSRRKRARFKEEIHEYEVEMEYCR